MNATTDVVILGADVSKDWLDLNCFGEPAVMRIDNTQAAIDAFLQPYRGAAIAVEATNRYHELLVARARRRGLIVYLISGYELKHYAAAIRRRMRTDSIDAQLLSRYLAHEREALVPYQPKSRELTRLAQLLKRRSLLVKQNEQRRQSFRDVPTLRAIERTLAQQHRRAIALIDRQLKTLSRELGWNNELARLNAVPGFGPLSSYALLLAYRSGRFVHHDPFVAYLGLDVRAKDSGKHIGKRKLTKRGDGEYRRLLYCAAMAVVRCQSYFKARYQALTQRGLAKTAALVVIARQLAKLAFHLLNKQTDFDPTRLKMPCSAT
jgi:transposase